MKYLKLKEYLKVAAFLLVANILCACSEDKPEGYYELESPYTVIDTGIKTVPRSKQKIYWLDNNTLLFYALSEQGEGLHLYYWPTKDLKLIHEMDVSLSQTYCYSDNIILVDKAHLKKNMDGYFKVYLEKNSLSRFVVSKKERSDDEKTFYRSFSCLSRDDLEPMKIWPLGYLEAFDYFVYKSDESENEIILKDKSDPKIIKKIKYNSKKFALQNKGYYPHLDKYLFVQVVSGLGNKSYPERYQFRFLNRDGVLESPFQMNEPWDKCSSLIPSKAGNLLGCLDWRKNYDFENKHYFDSSGIFLVVGEGRFDVIKILGGRNRGLISLSPNGCILAVDHYKYESKGQQYAKPTIKLINFCN